MLNFFDLSLELLQRLLLLLRQQLLRPSVKWPGDPTQPLLIELVIVLLPADEEFGVVLGVGVGVMQTELVLHIQVAHFADLAWQLPAVGFQDVVVQLQALPENSRVHDSL